MAAEHVSCDVVRCVHTDTGAEWTLRIANSARSLVQFKFRASPTVATHFNARPSRGAIGPDRALEVVLCGTDGSGTFPAGVRLCIQEPTGDWTALQLADPDAAPAQPESRSATPQASRSPSVGPPHNAARHRDPSVMVPAQSPPRSSPPPASSAAEVPATGRLQLPAGAMTRANDLRNLTAALVRFFAAGCIVDKVVRGLAERTLVVSADLSAVTLRRAGGNVTDVIRMKSVVRVVLGKPQQQHQSSRCPKSVFLEHPSSPAHIFFRGADDFEAFLALLALNAPHLPVVWTPRGRGDGSHGSAYDLDPVDRALCETKGIEPAVFTRACDAVAGMAPGEALNVLDFAESVQPPLSIFHAAALLAHLAGRGALASTQLFYAPGA